MAVIRLLLFLLAAVVVAAAGVAGFRHYERAKTDELLTRIVPVDIRLNVPRGATLAEIAAAGSAAGAPVTAAEFISLAGNLNVAAKLQAGHYRFSAGDSVRDILFSLAEGKVAPAERITIIEGVTFRALVEMLQNDSRLNHKTAHMTDEELRAKLQADAPFLEGMFLPETYFFNPGDSDLDVLIRARNDMQKALDELWANRNDGGLFETPYQALALASIVEKETGVSEERPLIASVFVNRLRKGMLLQADPTVIYGLGAKFDGNLTRAHLRDKSNLYNTYARRGLTPTPIALPGRAALSAALNPADTSYYYFVASGGGRHVFSKTLREHNNAVNRYQRRRK